MGRINPVDKNQLAGTEPCQRKLSLCGSFPITSAVAFHLVDHRPAAAAELSYEVYSGNGGRLNGTAARVDNVTAADSAGTFVSIDGSKALEKKMSTVYIVRFQLFDLGVHIVAIYLDGKQVGAMHIYISNAKSKHTHISQTEYNVPAALVFCKLLPAATCILCSY